MLPRTVEGESGLRRPAPGRLAPLVAGAVAFVVYAWTALPGIAFGDWGEMQTVPHVLGVAHPTGYPTYIMLAWLAELLPVGSVALRANLLSALLVSVALAAAAASLVRLGTRPIIAIAAVLAVGSVGTVWAAATVAEVNPLHLLFVALLVQRALVWQERRARRDLVIGALLLGLALGNHLLTLFVAPSIVILVVWVGRRELAAHPGWLLSAAAAGLAGLAVYLYIPIAAGQSPPLAYNHPVTLEGVWWLVSGEQFRGQFDFLSPGGPSEFVNALPALWSLLAGAATPVLPILGGVGLILLVWRRPAAGLMCVAILLTHLYVWSTYLRLEHYLLVPWLLLGMGAGVALDALANVLGSITSRPEGRRLDQLVGGAALLFVVGLAAMNWAASDRSGDRGGDDYVAALFAALPADAAVLSEWDASTPLWHAQFVLGDRPDVLVVDDTNIVYDGWGTRERRIESLICQRPVFILRLDDRDLLPTLAEFRLVPLLSVRVALGGPSAVVDRPVFRVEPMGATACPG